MTLYSRLFTSGSKPGVLYGLPKVHKEGCPVRPIMSAIGTFNYKLSKFLVPLLAPITTNQYSVKDSFSFVKELCEMNYGECIMASFDVKSLFTNIPLKETVNICVEDLFRDVENIEGFSKQQFHQLLSLAVTDCFFIFNKNVYKQVDGVAMGNPLGPTLANAFLAHYEVRWLDECPEEFKPLVYKRYVDDTFLIFRSSDHVPLFLEYLNSKHRNIEFTSETEAEGKLPFLDISITRNENSFTTSVYRKPTFTGLTTKMTSFIPIQFKRNLIMTLATRAFNICSNYVGMDIEFRFLKQCLYNNGFSKSLTDTYIGKQLEKLLIPKPVTATVSRAIMYFPITFYGRKSLNIKRKLTRLMREFYPQVNIRVIFKPKTTIQRFFRFKDVIPSELQSSIIYKYKCHDCNAMYLGKSKRQFRVRIFEHLGRSIRTNRPLSNPSFSAIRKHSEESDHRIEIDSFSVLTSRASDMELGVIESLYTLRDRPSLCNNERSVELLCF